MYSFVKEYGEGVDRMCKELDAVGLQEPKYYSNSFIRQTIIYNATTEKGTKDTLLESEKSAFEGGKLAIGFETSAIQSQKLAIGILKSAIQKQ